MSLRTVFQRVAREKVVVQHPEMHTRETMNDEMWRTRVGFVRVRPANVDPVFGRVCNRIDIPF